MYQDNPFVIEGYISPEYFCDRKEETALLIDHITNGRNVALIATRRLGKSGLIHNAFYQPEIQSTYYTFFVDIYETKNMNELAYELGKNILSVLKSQGKKAWEKFLSVLISLNHSITFNSEGMPIWSVKIGDIKHPDTTLDEIFEYLSNADRPCIVAIDEFQQIASYPEKTVEASLRKRIQNCHNAHFIYSGSQRHMMSQIFASPSRPFYNSCAIMGLAPIDERTYFDFANEHLATSLKSISQDAFHYLYDKFCGITWYIQYILNQLYALKTQKITLDTKDVDKAIDDVIRRNSFVYSSLIFQLSTKQKQLLYGIVKERGTTSIMSQAFLNRYSLSASTVQTAIKALLEHDFVTREEDGSYIVYDRFFDLWIMRSME